MPTRPNTPGTSVAVMACSLYGTSMSPRMIGLEVRVRRICAAAHLRYDFAALELTPPSPDLKAKLDGVLSRMGGDEITLSMRSLLRQTGLSGMVTDVDVKQRAGAHQAAPGRVRDAMRADLKRTL